MTQSDLAEFLNARLDEDAVRATMREWHACECDALPASGDEYTYPCGCGVPERMMRKAEADRAILAEHGSPALSPGFCQRCITDREDYSESWINDSYPCKTIRLLAAVYRDHADYRQEWGSYDAR